MMYKVYCDGTLIHDPSQNKVLINPVLTLEDSKAGSFEFTLPPTHANYSTVKKLTSVITVTRDDVEIWSGRVIEENVDFYKRKDIFCEGELAYLNDTTQYSAEYRGYTIRGFLEILIANHNQKVEAERQFTVGMVTVHDDVQTFTVNFDSTLNYINNTLVGVYGGHLRIRKSAGVRYIDYLESSPRTSNQVIQFGTNLLDFTQDFDLADMVTVVVPLGAMVEQEGQDTAVYTTIESVNDGKVYLASAEAVETYGWIETVVKFDKITSPSELKSKGQAYLNEVQYENMTLEVSAVDLHYLDNNADTIEILDVIRVVSTPHGLDRNFPVTKRQIPLMNPSNEKLTLGTAVRLPLTQSIQKTNSDILNQIVQIEEDTNMDAILDEAKRNASELIKNALNGHVVITDDASELLIMDTDDIETATKVWRWNLNGLGYSSTGYDGTYGLAMTMDGAIVADRITTGILNASIIRAGIIADLRNNNWWNLETGVLHISAGGVGTTEIAGGAITTEKIQANAITSDKIQAGSITADKLAAGVISTQLLYADQGDIAELTVDRINTSRRIVKYLTNDPSDDRHFEGFGMQFDFVISSVVYRQGSAQTTQLINRNGDLLYWEEEVTPAAIQRGDVVIINGYPYIPPEEGEEPVRIYVTTVDTGYPVIVYEYQDKVVRSLTFEQDPTTGYYQPVDIFGMGTVIGSDYGKAKMMKRTDGFEVTYTTRNGLLTGAYWTDDGFVDINHRRASISVNTGLQTITVQPEGEAAPISISYTESNDELTLTWEDGKSFTVEVV